MHPILNLRWGNGMWDEQAWDSDSWAITPDDKPKKPEAREAGESETEPRKEEE